MTALQFIKAAVLAAFYGNALIVVIVSGAKFELFDAFNEVKIERTNEVCDVVFGSVPSWLNGFFLRQTSGSWGKLSDPVPLRVENLYDAIGMGSAFRFPGLSQKPVYSNRYWRSMAYQVWKSHGKSLDNIGTAFFTHFSQTSPAIDQSVNGYREFLAFSPSHTFLKLGTQVEAVSDGTAGTKIDVATMENDGKPFPFSDHSPSLGLDGLMFNNAAHSVPDSTGTVWSAVYNANPSTGRTRLIVYQIIPTGTTAKRQIFAVKDFPQFSLAECSQNPSTPKADLREYLDVEHLPGYIHDIALTKDYVIIPTSSMLADYCYLLVYKNWASYGYAPFYTFSYKWRPDKYSTVQLVHRTSKKFYEVRIQPLFISHIINAFEDVVTGTVVLDVLTSNDGAYMAECSSLAAIINNGGFSCSTRVERIIIDIPDSAASRYRLTQLEWNFYEKPRINPKYAGQYYTRAYMVSRWLAPGESAVVKLNTRTTEVSQWMPDQNYLIDEVVFVPNPKNRDEEDGVLLVAGQDLNLNRGFIIILEPSTMRKLAEIQAPDSTPPGGHSQFYSFTDLGMQPPLTGSAYKPTSISLLKLTLLYALLYARLQDSLVAN